MVKELAIEKANAISTLNNEKYFVIYEPATYNDIFNGTCYKVVKEGEYNPHTVIYETS